MKLKQLFSFSAIFFCAVAVNAQQKNQPVSAAAFHRDFVYASMKSNSGMPINATSELYNINEEKYLKFKKMRTGGIILTSVGAGLIVTGAALINSAENERDDYYSTESGEGKAIAGVLSVLFGTLSTGGGITMWAIGNNKMKKYSGGNVLLKPTKSGIGLAYRL